MRIKKQTKYDNEIYNKASKKKVFILNEKAKKVAGKHAEQCVFVGDVNHKKRKLNQNIIYCFARL